MTNTVHVGLGDRAYDIHIGPGLLAQSGALIAPMLHRQRVAIITDENVAALAQTRHNRSDTDFARR